MFRRVVWMCGCLAVLGWTGDANAQQYTRVSVSTAGTQADGASGGAVFSGDSRFVVFSSSATNLVTGDTNGSNDVFIRDLVGHTTSRLSIATDGTERTGASGASAGTLPHLYGPNVSVNQDGSLVAFSSVAALDPADNNACGGHNCSDVYIRNRTLNTTALVSVASNNAVADNESGGPQVSGDGRYVVFTSLASNLVFGDQNGVEDVFLRDLTALTTTRISVSSTGNDLTAPSYGARISADGSVIAFVSDAPISSAPDPVPCAIGQTTCGRAYLFDRATNTMTRLPFPPLARASSGVVVTTVDITPDGRFVVMSLSHVYSGIDAGTMLAVYDRQTQRLSPDLDGIGTHGGPVTINASGRFVSIGGGSLRAFLAGGFTFDRQTTSYLQAPDIPVPRLHARRLGLPSPAPDAGRNEGAVQQRGCARRRRHQQRGRHLPPESRW
jgi:Tol biopolymer transport system component